MNELAPGLSAELSITVSAADTAAQWGSGLVPVYSTPALVGLMEAAAVRALEGHLEQGQTSVGAHIDVHHLAATPVGMQVRAQAKLVAVEGRKLSFKIEAWDAEDKIGEARHERILVNTEKFVMRAGEKQKRNQL